MTTKPPSPFKFPELKTPTVFTKPGATVRGERIVLFGSGGIGKTSLATLAPGPVAVFDLDESLDVLAKTQELPDDLTIVPASSWAELRGTLRDMALWTGIQTIIIDSGTKAEEWDIAHVLENVPKEKGGKCKHVEDYGFGKGLTYIYEEYMNLLCDLDAHCRAGRHVVLICHDCTATVPNPEGEDFLRFEPRLQSPNSGKNSIRLRVKEWADHLIFIGLDQSVDDSGRRKTSGTRTIYPCEKAHCMAKSRTLSDPFEYVQGDDSLWIQLGLKQQDKEN